MHTISAYAVSSVTTSTAAPGIPSIHAKVLDSSEPNRRAAYSMTVVHCEHAHARNRETPGAIHATNNEHSPRIVAASTNGATSRFAGSDHIDTLLSMRSCTGPANSCAQHDAANGLATRSGSSCDTHAVIRVHAVDKPNTAAHDNAKP